MTELETTGYSISPASSNGAFPTLDVLTGLKANITARGRPLNFDSTNLHRERQLQSGLRARF